MLLGGPSQGDDHRDIIFLDHLQEMWDCPRQRRLGNNILGGVIGKGYPGCVYVISMVERSQQVDTTLIVRNYTVGPIWK